MPKTISDEEYGRLLGRAQIADLVEPVYNDPALSKEAKALLKKKYPGLQIPDYDIEEKFEQRFAQERQEREEREQKQRAAEEDKRFQEARSGTQKKYGLTDDGMKDVEKFMIERNVGDYDVAASYVVAQNPKPSSADFNDGRWNHDKAPGFAEIAKDPEGWGRSEILKALYTQQEREKNQRF